MEYVMYSRKAGPAIGQMVCGGFGTLWMIDWCLRTRGMDLATLMLIALAGGTMLLWAWSDFRAARAHLDAREPVSAYKARQRSFHWINGIQWLAVIVANLVLNLMGRPEWVVPAIILIVGVHFLPLARVFHARRHIFTGLAMIAVALLFPWVPRDGLHYPAGEFATGSILWLNALYSFIWRRAGTDQIQSAALQALS